MAAEIVTALSSLGGGGGSLLPKVINVPADFPTTIEANAERGRIYIGGGSPSVTDNDVTKTNTGFVLLLGNEVVWNGTTYVDLGPNAIWVDDGTDVKTVSARNVNLAGNGLKDTYVTTPIKLGDVSNTSFDTVNKTIVGAVNELLSSITGITPVDLTTQLSTGGVTSFTLPSAPKTPNASLLFYNGQQEIYGVNFTISGTTLTWITTPPSYALDKNNGINSFWIFYDITSTPPGSLDQERMFYYAGAGADTNIGKSIEAPVQTLVKALSLASALSPIPSITNPVQIYRVGTELNTENFTIPTGVHVHAPSSIFTGIIAGQANSSLDCLEIKSPATTTFTAPSLINMKNKDMVIARLTSKLLNQTGKDGTEYIFNCDAEDLDTRSHYDNATGEYTADIKQLARVSLTAVLSDLAAANDKLQLYIKVVGVAASWFIYELDPSSVRIADTLILAGSDMIILEPGDVVSGALIVGGNASDNVSVDIGTKLTVEAIRYL